MKIAIVGGAGKMGQCLAAALLRHGQQVTLIDRDSFSLKAAGTRLGAVTIGEPSLIKGVDAVVLAVPITGFEEVIRAIAPFTRSGQIVIDITSVKSMPVDVMHRHLPHCLVLGTHPVFGPGTERLSGQNVVLTPTNEAENALAENIKRLLEAEGASVTLMTPKKHDELMAVVLGMAHYIALTAGDTLLGLDNFKELSQISGPTFRGLLAFIESVVHEDPALYAAIQMNIDPLPAMQQRFIDKAGEWAEKVKNKDAAGFSIRMADLSAKMKNNQIV
jgi:prephenate dehydrogenase